MAFKKVGKHYMVYGRRPRGAAKRARSGPVPKKTLRRVWLQAPGEAKKAAAQRRFDPPSSGPVYGRTA